MQSHFRLQRFDVSHAEGRHVDSPNDGAVLRYGIGLKLSDAVLVKRTPIVGCITGNHHLIVTQKPLQFGAMTADEGISEILLEIPV